MHQMDFEAISSNGRLRGIVDGEHQANFGNVDQAIKRQEQKSRLSIEAKKEDGVELSITHREVAALTGLTKETISRECTKLEQKGLIKNTNHLVVIKNMNLLESELMGT